jgi:hypothetical protein
MVYVGVDLHRKRSHVVALDPAGEVVLSRRIGNAPGEFLRIFGELEPQPIEVAFEATYGWSWFADLLADAGIPAHMAHPLATKAISAARVTNDAVDAKTLAHLLRTQPAGRGLDRPTGGPGGPPAGPHPRWAGPHALPRPIPTSCAAGRPGRHPRADHPVRPGRAPLAGRTPAVGRCPWSAGRRPATDRRHHPRGHPRRRRPAHNLRRRPTHPTPAADSRHRAGDRGHRGPEVWDIQRFPSPERLCSWAGLTPGERTSDAHTRRGHITKQGSR